MGCINIILLAALAVFIMVSILRWFEQVTEAVEQKWWNKVMLLVMMPFTAWFFPSRISAGRPTIVPRHEPVRGFGGLPKGGIEDPKPVSGGGSGFGVQGSGQKPAAVPPPQDGPPPGTPKEFLEKPIPTPTKKKSSVDPEKLEKLRQKMKDQGML